MIKTLGKHIWLDEAQIFADFISDKAKDTIEGFGEAGILLRFVKKEPMWVQFSQL